MTGWIASLSAAEAGNWKICRQDAWFGTGAPRGAGVRRGDELFMWQSQQGLFAYCFATDDAERVSERSHVPWPHPEKYRYVWPIEIVHEMPQALDTTWSELDVLAGIGGVPASQLPPIAEDRTADVRALFHGMAGERLVRIAAGDAVRRDLRAIDSEYDARVLVERAIRIRQGQGGFRAQLLAAYERTCAVTGCDVEEVLEAAHISPYRGELTNRVWNGLLLRADVHVLFDLDRLTVLPGGMLRCHPDLNDTPYGEFAGKPIRPPRTAEEAPAAKLLLEHNARCAWLSKV